jgi:hypothetical protein
MSRNAQHFYYPSALMSRERACPAILLRKLVRNRETLLPEYHLPIIKSAVSARRRIIDRDSGADGILPGIEVLVLPDPPGAIYLCMVKPEGGVTWRCEEVSAWVASDCIMSFI